MNTRQRLLGISVVAVTLLLPAPASAGGAAVTPTGEAVVPGGPQAHAVGGTPVSVKDHPFIIAGLRLGGSRPQGQTCTGSVVAPRKILIAAHCKAAEGEKTFLYGLDDLNAGGGTRVGVVSYDPHPKYVNFDQGYDVAVVTTDADIPVPDGGYAKVATSADTELSKPGNTGLGLGYGKKDRNDDSHNVELHKFSLPIVPGSDCSGVGAGFREATMICSGYRDGRVTILPGDSGGPLIVDGKVVGVASWSRSDFRWYSVYGRLDNDMGDWVGKQLRDPRPDDIKVRVNPDSGTVHPGFLTEVTVSVAEGTGTITLSATGPGLPFAPFFTPRTLSGSGTSLMRLAAPTERGTYPVTVTATDSAGKSAASTYTLTVQ